jgi:hypothetical protein
VARSAPVRALTLLLLLAACSSSPTETVTPGPKFEILGADMSGFNQNIFVSLNGSGVAGLSVTVSGTAMTDQGGGTYNGHLPTALPAGTAVQVRVTNGTLTGIGDAIVPVAPVVTGAAHTTIGAPVTITWTTPTSPDSFLVVLDYRMPDQSTGAVVARVGGNLRQVQLATTGIPANGVVFAAGVDAYMHGSFSGDAAPTSSMHLRATSASFDVTIP